MFDIQEELKKLPQKPGVYLMKDVDGHVIYVGKAINLKNRVRQYFQSSRNQTVKTQSMVPNIKEFEYIVKPMMNEQGLVNGAMAKAILADKYPLFAKIVPENDFRLADVAEPVSNVIKAIKERAI